MAGVTFCTEVCPGECPCGSGGGGGGTGDCTGSIAGGVQRQTGVGVINVPVGAQSVSVTVLFGDITLSIGGGPAVTLPAGYSQSWAVTGCAQTLNQAYVFTADAGGDDFIVSTTT